MKSFAQIYLKSAKIEENVLEYWCAPNQGITQMRRLHLPDARMEALESRRLMSVFVRNHVLHILGTEGDDTIKFLGHTTSQLRLSVNGEVFRFERTQVQRISINAGDGNDSITIGANNAFALPGTGPLPGCEPNCPQIANEPKIISIPGTVRGGPGDDTIVGGVGRWNINGGSGNDVIRAWASSTSSISGGDGDDTLIGGGLNDHLIGGEGDDVLIGGAGDDTLDGGPGLDTLKGGQGHDTLILGPQPPPPPIFRPQLLR